jgi:phenylpropionate dioxygenase-like ring-hydroxylating dioxygenase large terminal subunit
MAFLVDAWYVAAFSEEITDQPFARTILGVPLVFWRLPDGQLAVLEDRCCHRAYPLSRGQVADGQIRCGYHGMVYDQSGACTKIPWQKVIPKVAQVRAYAAVDRFGWVWVWMGDAKAANPENIPDYHWLDASDWGAKADYLHVQCDYRLIIENLLDLTHLAFVHASTIGNSAVAEQADVKFDRSDTDVTVTRWTLDAPPPPTYAKVGHFPGHVDRWQIINFEPPGYIRLDVGACPAGTGAPQGHFENGIRMRNMNVLTPESETSTHYFWGQAHDFDVTNSQLTDTIFGQVKTAFLEDVAVFEAQQQRINLEPERGFVNFSGDVGGVAALRLLDQRISG